MKKILLLTIMLLAFVLPCALADEWVQVPNVDNTFQKDMAWYYSPSHAKISPQGRLAAWIKSEYIGTQNTPMSSPGDYTIWEVYVNPSFDKSMIVRLTDYKYDGTVKRVKNGYEWDKLMPGSNFENCLQAAYKYVKDNNN